MEKVRNTGKPLGNLFLNASLGQDTFAILPTAKRQLPDFLSLVSTFVNPSKRNRPNPTGTSYPDW